MTPLPCPHSETVKFKSPYKLHLKPEVLSNTLSFHMRTQFAYPKNISSTYFGFIPGDVLRESERTETFLLPVYPHSIDLHSKNELPIRRTHSAQKFTKNNIIPFGLISDVLKNSFLSFDDENGVSHKPYPSAGALYPIEVIMILHFNSKSPNLDIGAYHLLADQKKLAKLLLPVDRTFDHRTYFEGEFGLPSFSLVYVLNLPKAIFKYQYRGYRHALMEIGSMYQQAALSARHAKLSSRSWSGFSDDLISSSLGFNKQELLPILIQCFGMEVTS